MQNKLIVVLDGGLVQCIVGTGAMVGASVTVIDYDTDGGDESEFTPVRQADGSETDAYVRTETVEAATIPCGSFPPLHATESPALAACRAFVAACGGNPPDWLREEFAAAESAVDAADAVPTDPVKAARAALDALIFARECFKVSGSVRALDKTKDAISSAKGAVRHAEGKAMR